MDVLFPSVQLSVAGSMHPTPPQVPAAGDFAAGLRTYPDAVRGCGTYATGMCSSGTAR